MATPRPRLQAEPEGDLPGLRRRDVLALAALGVVAGSSRAALAAAPQSELTWGLHVSLAPNWFDPADTQALITPFMVLYALHDAMVKPMPGTTGSASSRLAPAPTNSSRTIRASSWSSRRSTVIGARSPRSSGW